VKGARTFIAGLILAGLALGTLATESGLAQTPWSDDFDSYLTGSQMHGQGGWKGWDNNPLAGALTSNAYQRSGPNSVAIAGPSIWSTSTQALPRASLSSLPGSAFPAASPEPPISS
jgi:hypothetical protein